jgi:hypothetical protein
VAHVPKASQSNIKAQTDKSISRYGLIANALQIHSKKERAIFIVVQNFPTNCS